MKVKSLGLVLIAAGFLVGCGGEDLNKNFKATPSNAPMPSAMGAGASSQAKPAATPP
jgi:hypothetical protein